MQHILFCKSTRGLLSSLLLPKDHGGEQVGQVHSVWAPQRGSKKGGPYVSWHLLGLNSGMG